MEPADAILAQSDSIGGYIALATAVLYMLAQLGGIFGKREPGETKPSEGGSDIKIETEPRREAPPPPPVPKAKPAKVKPPRARPADSRPRPVPPPSPRPTDGSRSPAPSPRRQEDFSPVPVPRSRPAAPAPSPVLESVSVEMTGFDPLETISAVLRRGMADKPKSPPALRPSGLLSGLRTREGLRAAIAMSEVLGRPVSERRDHLAPP